LGKAILKGLLAMALGVLPAGRIGVACLLFPLALVLESLDAPVSGGQPKAIESTLSVMVGGKQEVGAPLPVTAFVTEIMQALKTEGLGDSDHGAMVQYFEKQANVEIKRPALM